jgi:hypothetical protein
MLISKKIKKQFMRKRPSKTRLWVNFFAIFSTDSKSASNSAIFDTDNCQALFPILISKLHKMALKTKDVFFILHIVKKDKITAIQWTHSFSYNGE